MEKWGCVSKVYDRVLVKGIRAKGRKFFFAKVIIRLVNFRKIYYMKMMIIVSSSFYFLLQNHNSNIFRSNLQLDLWKI